MSQSDKPELLCCQQKGVVHLKVKGDFDHALNQAFQAVIRQYPGSLSYLIDLQSISSICAEGIGLMMMVWKHCGGDRNQLFVVTNHEVVDRLLNIACVDKMFQISQLCAQQIPPVQPLDETLLQPIGASNPDSHDAVVAQPLQKRDEERLFSRQLDELGGGGAVVQQPVQPTAIQPEAVDLELEFPLAQAIRQQATQQVKGALYSLAQGGGVEVGPIANTCQQIQESFRRNRNSALALAMLKDKSAETYTHSVNVATYLIAFCQHLGMDERTTINVGLGGMLHDVGKSFISADLYQHAGRLSQGTMQLVRRHALLGHKALQKIPGMPQEVLTIALAHHERLDGSGYPSHKMGDDVPAIAQMAGIADAFDAITSPRPYHQASTPIMGLQKIMSLAGKSYDKTLTQQFVQAIGVYPVGTLVELGNGTLGVVAENHPDALLEPAVHVVYDNKRRSTPPERVSLAEHKGDPQFKISTVVKQPPPGFNPFAALNR
ncbi:HD domain-containing phosphohydrolase [Magnetococcus sp. PR-3]|uniref:HD domain-containing phosphohydrolase n=1 Tax=Magnetococcus sp. PR-3 TaxID=3120355 RepID=UPI002FCE2C2C